MSAARTPPGPPRPSAHSTRGWLGALVVVGACAHRRPLPPPPPAEGPTTWQAVLADARSPLPGELRNGSLVVLHEGQPGLTWHDDGRLLVTTWSRSAFYDAATVPGHSFPLYGETWFTAAGELRAACAGLEDDERALRMEQLLGLPAGGGRDVVLELWIDPELLFRPCSDPDPTRRGCGLDAPLATDGTDSWWACTGATDPHADWLCDTWVDRYGPTAAEARFPWTALGYTYDWADLDDPVGATEFVAPAGSPVELLRMRTNADYYADAAADPQPG